MSVCLCLTVQQSARSSSSIPVFLVVDSAEKLTSRLTYPCVHDFRNTKADLCTMSVHHKIDKHLASLENYDKDERYMGTSDLCNLLQTGTGTSTGDRKGAPLSLSL